MGTKDIKAGCKSTQLILISGENSEKDAGKIITRTESETVKIASCIPRTVRRHFPQMLSAFARIPDVRKAKGKTYAIEELLMGALFLFLLKEGSRNRINNHRKDGYFAQHYHRMTALRLPHQDTVADLLCELPCEHLEQVRMDLMSALFEQKWLRQYRLLGKYYLIAVDATGVVSFDRPHCEHCLTKTKGKTTTWFHYVLEAKLVTRDGHALSLASEWIENPSGAFDKQDCERKAFIRLAAKLKKQYPRLPVCILADGLYPYENAFNICEEYDWKYIFVLQDKSLKTVQEEIDLTRLKPPVYTFNTLKNGWWIDDECRFQTDIVYHKKYVLHWVQCVETRKKQVPQGKKSTQPVPPEESSCFEYLTNIKPDRENIREICTGGRLRWKIENEGFNTQKCGDYELQHKYCEKSYNGLKNYYTLLQIAHAVNQLIEKEKCITEILKLRPKETLRNLWDKVRGYMIFCLPRDACDGHHETGAPVKPAPA